MCLIIPCSCFDTIKCMINHSFVCVGIELPPLAVTVSSIIIRTFALVFCGTPHEVGVSSRLIKSLSHLHRPPVLCEGMENAYLFLKTDNALITYSLDSPGTHSNTLTCTLIHACALYLHTLTHTPHTLHPSHNPPSHTPPLTHSTPHTIHPSHNPPLTHSTLTQSTPHALHSSNPLLTLHPSHNTPPPHPYTHSSQVSHHSEITLLQNTPSTSNLALTQSSTTVAMVIVNGIKCRKSFSPTTIRRSHTHSSRNQDRGEYTPCLMFSLKPQVR